MLPTDARALSKLLSELCGRNVRFAPMSKPPVKAPAIYGAYQTVPSERPFVMQVDAALLGLWAGTLLGLPDDLAMQRAAQAAEDEPLRDAMHEVLNITSSALSGEERVVLKKMERTVEKLAEPGTSIMRAPESKVYFNVFVADKLAGGVTLLA